MTGTHKPAAIRRAEDVKLIHSVNPAAPLSLRAVIIYFGLIEGRFWSGPTRCWKRGADRLIASHSLKFSRFFKVMSTNLVRRRAHHGSGLLHDTSLYTTPTWVKQISKNH